MARDSDRARLYGGSNSTSSGTHSRTGSAGVKMSTFSGPTSGVHVMTHTLSKVDTEADRALELGVKHKSAYWLDSEAVRDATHGVAHSQGPRVTFGQ